jgi:hypothetical protein
MSRVSRCIMLACWLCGGAAWAQPASAPSEVQALYAEGQAAYNSKDYAVALAKFQACIEKGAKTHRAAYDGACCAALLGQTDEAFRLLHLAIERGFHNVDHMQRDSDLTSLHTDVRWAKALHTCGVAYEKHMATLKEPALAKELARRRAIDQQARSGTTDQIDVHKLLEVDADNTAWMKTVIEKHGWPGKSLVGDAGAEAAWLLVQHADADPMFQERCLELLVAAQSAGEASGVHVAYLTDRVRVAAGKPQLYGTQFYLVAGKNEPRPIEDEANLDKRRAEMGLGPFESYRKQMQSLP